MTTKFELNSLPRNCSNEEIITEIRRVDSIVNKDHLVKRDYDQYGKMTSGRIQQRFGGWQKALIAAGLGHKYSGRKISDKMRQQSKSLTDEEILNELREIAKKLDQDYVSQEDVNTRSEIISASTVIYRFGSWHKGIEKAGLKVSRFGRRFSIDEYFENLLNVWTYHGRQPFLREMNETPSMITSGAYESRFGSWRKALEAFVAKMNQDSSEFDQEEVSTVVEESKEIIREEIKKHSVLAEDRNEIKLGLRYKVLSRDKFKCVKCGSSPAINQTCRLHIDHIIPFSKEGKTTLENLQTLCEKCNLGKGNRYFE
jgi:hypothetical protein